MKTSLPLFLIIGFLQLNSILNAQHLKVGEPIYQSSDILQDDFFNSKPENYEYDFIKEELSYYVDDKWDTNKVIFPLSDIKLNWFPLQSDDRLYFAYSTYEDFKYTLYFAPYNYKDNQLGKTKIVLQTKSETYPDESIIRSTGLCNSIYFTVRAGTRNDDTAAAVLDYDLNMINSINVPYTYTSRELKNDMENVLGEDGCTYQFGFKIEGQKKETKATYGAFVTYPEGNTSEFIRIPIDDLGYISNIQIIVEKDKIIQYGTWSKQSESEEMSGIFYLELSTVNLRVLKSQIKTIPITELTSYSNNNLDSKSIEKRESINGISLQSSRLENLKFADGKYVAVFRREYKIETTPYALGAFFIATFGPKPEDMTIKMVRVDQRIPGLDPTHIGPRVGFETGIYMLNNHLIIIFNDNIANAGVTNSGEVVDFKPYPGETKTIATFALIINAEGNIIRERLFSYATDKLLFHRMSSIIDENSFYIITVNDTNYDNFNEKDEEKISKRIVQFTN